jgi:hypothetical protein
MVDPLISQPMCCRSGWKPFFSGAVALLNSVDDYVKDCYTRTVQDTYSRGSYADRVWDACDMLVRFPLQGVHRFKSP